MYVMDSKYCSGCKLNRPLSSFLAKDQHDRVWVACIICRTWLSARCGRREAEKVVQKELKAVEENYSGKISRKKRNCDCNSN
jgi:hypothetical protein